MKHKAMASLSCLFFILTFLSSSFANYDESFAVTLPGWIFQPKSTHHNLQAIPYPEFMGLLNKRGEAFAPSMYVLKINMPKKKTIQDLDTWLNKKYFKNKATLTTKSPIPNQNGYGSHTYTFITKENGLTQVNYFYTFEFGKDLIILSQTTLPSSRKEDLHQALVALNHIKFIN